MPLGAGAGTTYWMSPVRSLGVLWYKATPTTLLITMVCAGERRQRLPGQTIISGLMSGTASVRQKQRLVDHRHGINTRRKADLRADDDGGPAGGCLCVTCHLPLGGRRRYAKIWRQQLRSECRLTHLLPKATGRRNWRRIFKDDISTPSRLETASTAKSSAGSLASSVAGHPRLSSAQGAGRRLGRGLSSAGAPAGTYSTLVDLSRVAPAAGAMP